MIITRFCGADKNNISVYKFFGKTPNNKLIPENHNTFKFNYENIFVTFLISCSGSFYIKL